MFKRNKTESIAITPESRDTVNGQLEELVRALETLKLENARLFDKKVLGEIGDGEYNVRVSYNSQCIQDLEVVRIALIERLDRICIGLARAVS